MYVKFKMHTKESKVLIIAVLLIVIRSNLGSSIAPSIEIHFTNDNTTLRKNKMIQIQLHYYNVLTWVLISSKTDLFS